MSLFRTLAVVVAVAVAAVYLYLALRGPQGIPVLLSKWEEIRELQKRNADLATAVKQRQDRLRLIKESQAEQELLVRRVTKRLGKNDTSYIIPKDGSAVSPAAMPPPPAAKKEEVKPVEKPKKAAPSSEEKKDVSNLPPPAPLATVPMIIAPSSQQ